MKQPEEDNLSRKGRQARQEKLLCLLGELSGLGARQAVHSPVLAASEGAVDIPHFKVTS
jgi:hypothetical protein